MNPPRVMLRLSSRPDPTERIERRAAQVLAGASRAGLPLAGDSETLALLSQAAAHDPLSPQVVHALSAVIGHLLALGSPTGEPSSGR